MKIILKLENGALLLLTVYLYFAVFHLSWLVLILCLFLPDLSMVGYLVDSKIGAMTYNSVHNLVVPSTAIFLGLALDNSLLVYIGLILFIHIFMDRLLGYGLKYADDFKHTHLD
ncbi:DUF4260 domain-containing protein [Candidatus Enterococcus clewellii]|uniref:DUF4260 domain-containing protein n=1 Tax=Candidatus Enterococcus clewellii TaxID=1834193 RepID=A0A242K4B0_9ENTE|nr:DUF4260 domain-containing protein [Enterococcus sp. 9E7_DIV0242]OTP14371.1 hypothetical protein A5888_002472 [Enterococcus sp. 9E7_DIV0242]